MKYGWATCLPHKDGGVPLSALPKGTSKLAGLFSTLSFFMLSAKQGSCEYHFLKSFGMTRLGERTQVYRLGCGRSHHYTKARVIPSNKPFFSPCCVNDRRRAAHSFFKIGCLSSPFSCLSLAGFCLLILLLLLMSGNVQPNPGPIFLCSVCAGNVAWWGRSVQCCTCFKWVHLRCSLLSFSKFRALGSSHSWSCPPFRFFPDLLSESLDSLLCNLIAHTPDLAFSLLMARTLAAASSFSSGRAFLSLNFLLLLFLRLTPTLITYVSTSL